MVSGGYRVVQPGGCAREMKKKTGILGGIFTD